MVHAFHLGFGRFTVTFLFGFVFVEGTCPHSYILGFVRATSVHLGVVPFIDLQGLHACPYQFSISWGFVKGNLSE